jgi:hypothetical protein
MVDLLIDRHPAEEPECGSSRQDPAHIAVDPRPE